MTDWRSRLDDYCDAGRQPGTVRLRIPDDMDALIDDWRELQSAVWLLRRDCVAMGGTSWRATRTAKVTARWER